MQMIHVRAVGDLRVTLMDDAGQLVPSRSVARDAVTHEALVDGAAVPAHAHYLRAISRGELEIVKEAL